MTAYADGDSMVHLALVYEDRTLCGHAVRDAEQRPSFRSAGCRACLVAALEASQTFAQDSDRIWINLSRIS